MRFQAGIVVLSLISAAFSSPIAVVNDVVKRDSILDRESAVISGSDPSPVWKRIVVPEKPSPVWKRVVGGAPPSPDWKREEEGVPTWKRAEEGTPAWKRTSEDQSS
ncbi:hypothetical protein C8J56DRAFT_916684 [Mycena floridula]|nr:hypothetical protein C8J56DRAFT_916684 [Mycena floridula]